MSLPHPLCTTHCTHLLIKPFDPPIQILQLLRPQILAGIQRPIQILRQHLLIEALTRQSSRCISSREVFVGPAGTVEVAAGRDVVDFATDGEVDRGVVLAVVFEEGARGECLEDARAGLRGEGDGVGGAEEAEVDYCEEQEEEGDVKRCGYDEAVGWVSRGFAEVRDGGGRGGTRTRACVLGILGGLECEGQKGSC